MRETKDQTIDRLEKKIEEQKKEMTEIKKDRKRLNYAVERLERQIQKLSAQSSKDDIKKITELESQIEELKSAIEEKETEMAKREKKLNQTIKDCNFQYRNLTERYEEVRTSVTAEFDGYVDDALKQIVNFRKGRQNNIGNLSYYENGDKFYIENVNGKECEMPIFSTSDLFIQIHPKTGQPLTDIHFKLLKEWAFLNFDYQQFYSPYDEWLNRNKMVANDGAIVATSYEVGKKLLPFYEHLLF